jgi:hypothetical protein
MRLVLERNTCGENIAGEKKLNHARQANDYRGESRASLTTDPQSLEKQRFWESRRNPGQGGPPQ